MSIIIKQPNGKYCRYSSVVDCPTHINMSKEDYIKLKENKISKEEAIDILENDTYSFEFMKDIFSNNNITKKRFNELCKKMQDPNGKFEIC